jgi:hypothetical protein
VFVVGNSFNDGAGPRYAPLVQTVEDTFYGTTYLGRESWPDATDGGTCRPIGMPGDATVGFQATSK